MLAGISVDYVVRLEQGRGPVPSAQVLGALTRALLHDPQVILLDEPTSAMDPASAKLVRDHIWRLKEQGKTFLIEYDNTQNEANHIHSVWRDFDSDFGMDLLGGHVKAAIAMATASDSFIRRRLRR